MHLLCLLQFACQLRKVPLSQKHSDPAITLWHHFGARNYSPGTISVLAFFIALRYQRVMNRDSIDQLAAKLAETIPQGLRSVRADLEENFRSVLHASLARLDLVTREEFEVQQAVLARTREKLDALEERLATLSEPAKKSSAGKGKKATKKKKAAKKKASKKF